MKKVWSRILVGIRLHNGVSFDWKEFFEHIYPGSGFFKQDLSGFEQGFWRFECVYPPYRCGETILTIHLGRRRRSINVYISTYSI